MLREYIISEAMHGLGIPTTRSLAVVTTGETVIRETNLPGAILTRVATSHIRVGTFQYVANGVRGGTAGISRLYTKRHYPEMERRSKVNIFRLLQEVIKRQATLIAQWQLVGFIHGVMNTDNMAISGETIDYGPCAFMDTYDPATVFSSIDSKAAMPIAINQLLARGILRDLLKPYCRCSMKMRMKLSNWPRMQFQIILNCIKGIG